MNEPPSIPIDINDVEPTIRGQVIIYCECVEKDMKSVALMPVQDRFVDVIIAYVKAQSLKTMSQKSFEGWQSIYIYKHDFMLEVLKALPETPKSVYDHWVLGKAFGYSDAAISEFISNYKTTS